MELQTISNKNNGVKITYSNKDFKFFIYSSKIFILIHVINTEVTEITIYITKNKTKNFHIGFAKLYFN